jgi:molybdopterin molybdotransferase
VISVDEACRLIEALPLRARCERVALEDACDRILAKPVVASHWAPRCDVSAMDGYAVREADIAGAPARLRVVGQSFAGDPTPPALPPGACMRIFTGAPAPRGADRVVIQEVVRREGDVLLLDEAPRGARHIRRAGSDFSPGEILIDTGARLTPQALVAAAAADLSEVEVFARPRVAIISTGDELAEPGAARAREGAIPESVSFGVAGLVRAWGGEVVSRRRVADDLPALAASAAAAVGEAEIVVVTGGASVGERDHAKAMFAPLGLEILFSKVAMKPGKPVWLGRVGETLVVGLPGNPSAALITARLFLAPLVAALAGRPAAEAWAWRTAPLARPLDACAERECFHKGRAGLEGAVPFANQDSSGQKELAAADLLIRRRPGARALRAGERVETLAF